MRRSFTLFSNVTILAVNIINRIIGFTLDNKSIFILAFAFIPALSLMSQQVSRDKVILEIGTGTWCQYCPGAANGAKQLLANGHQVAAIKYHSGDPYSNSYGAARISYYGISGFPTAKFDGILTSVGGGGASTSMYSAYLPLYNQRISLPSSFTIDVQGSNSSLELYTLDVTVEKVASATTTNKVVHVVLTESNIPQSWQGMTQVDQVQRLMAPSHTGTLLNFTNSDIVELTIPFIRNSNWVISNCEVVIFVQDVQTKEILQGIKRPLTDFVTTNSNDVAIAGAMFPKTICNNILSPKILVKNYGLSTITSMDVSVIVNSDNVSTIPWTGNIEFMESEMVDFPEITFTLQNSNTISIEVLNPNGQSDQYPVNNIYTNTMEQAPSVTSPVMLALKLDQNPHETTWQLTNSTGEVFYSGGPYSQPNQFIVQNFVLPDPDCYTFSIYDSGTDGLTGSGVYMLAYDGNNFFAQGNDFGFADQVQFFTGLTSLEETTILNKFSLFPNPAENQTMIEFHIDEPMEVWLTINDMTGTVVYSSTINAVSEGMQTISINTGNISPGVYLVSLKTGNENLTRKLVIR